MHNLKIKVTNALFGIGLVFKGLDSVLEVIGGILLFAPVKVAEEIVLLSQHELYRDHANAARHLERAAAAVEHASPLGAAYLMVHGLAKVILIAAIFWKKSWGYKGLIAILSLFTLVETYRAISAREPWVLLIALFDAALAYLTWKEYTMHFSKKNPPQQARE